MKSLGSLRLQPYDEIEINKCKNVEQRFVCIHCIEICFSIEKLKLHYVNVHGYKSPESEKKVTTKVCSICRMSFKNAKTLSKHVKTVHYKIMSFICSVCSKQFSRKATLDIHLRQHLSDETAKTICCPHPNCGFRASDPSVMSKHKKIHQKTNEGKYKCPEESCKYFAIQATGLKNHMISKHHDLFEATMKCSLCEFVSVNPERLRRHLNDHEKGLLTVNEAASERKPEAHRIEESQKRLNSSMEISSDCFLPMESNHAIDTGGVTIIHIHNTNSSTNVHSEDTVF